MSSGCNINPTKRPINIIPDRGIKYTGPAYPSFNICTGDYLDEIEIVVLNKLTEFAQGKGITIASADFTKCEVLDEFVKCCAADKSLEAIVDGILRTFCKVDSKFEDVDEEIEEVKNLLNYSLNKGCLEVTDSKIDTILNKLVSEFCKLLTQLTNIFGNLDDPTLNVNIVNKITDSVINSVFNNIKSCAPGDIVKTGTGVDTILTIKGQAPIGALMFGVWDSSYFDSTGLGLADKGMCGWAVANGKNGTVDAAGFTLAMATNTIRGGNALDPMVDPLVLSDADTATNIGDKKGAYKVKITALQSGQRAHFHSITDKSHTHTETRRGTRQVSNGSTNAASDGIDSAQTSSSFTGITATNSVEALNAEQAHENRQPTKYVNCIQRIA